MSCNGFSNNPLATRTKVNKMQRSKLLLPLALTLASVATFAADDKPTYDLSLRAKTGTVVKSNVDITIQIGPVPLTMTAKQTDTYAQDKESKANSIGMKFEQGSVEIMGETTKEPNCEYTVELAKDGQFAKIIEVDVPKPDEEAMGFSTIIYFQAMGASVAPTKKVAIGDKWSADLKAPDLKEKYPSEEAEEEEKDESKMATKYELVAIEKVGEIECAKVSFESTSDDKESQMTGKGFFWLDLSNGVVLKRDFKIDLGGEEGMSWTVKTAP